MEGKASILDTRWQFLLLTIFICILIFENILIIYFLSPGTFWKSPDFVMYDKDFSRTFSKTIISNGIGARYFECFVKNTGNVPIILFVTETEVTFEYSSSPPILPGEFTFVKMNWNAPHANFTIRIQAKGV